jgi:hypothetical protein
MDVLGRRTVGVLLGAVTTALVVTTAACGSVGDDDATTTTAEVTLTTEAGTDLAALGEQVLVVSGARGSVGTGGDAEARMGELAVTWCRTALRSDVDNADATFRFSLNEYFTDHGAVRQDGEVQDVPLAKAMLAGTYADALALAANEVVCPEVERPDA